MTNSDLYTAYKTNVVVWFVGILHGYANVVAYYCDNLMTTNIIVCCKNQIVYIKT